MVLDKASSLHESCHVVSVTLVLLTQVSCLLNYLARHTSALVSCHVVSVTLVLLTQVLCPSVTLVLQHTLYMPVLGL